jgi:hypothetical protein
MQYYRVNGKEVDCATCRAHLVKGAVYGVRPVRERARSHRHACYAGSMYPVVRKDHVCVDCMTADELKPIADQL